MGSRRLLLLSLSGVRVKNEALLRAGMTLPGFVDRSRVIASLPSLGLLILAAHCPPHWEPVYEDVDGPEPELADRIARERYDVVALSALSPRIDEAYRLAGELRERGVTVVLGGLHVSALPDEARAFADAVVVGEGETVLAHLLADFEAGRLRPLYRGKAPADLSRAPVPRYDLLDPARYDRLPLQTTRGCPLTCSFCGASRRLGPYRRKSLDRVEAELAAIHALWPRPFVELADDNTFVHKGWSRELVKCLRRYGVRWFTETDISVADDERLLESLAASGCAQVLIGLESALPQSLEGLGDRGWKRRRYDAYLPKLEKIHSFGVSVNGCFILGLDGDGPDCFRLTRDFIRAAPLAEAQITLLTPFPGTPLYRSLRSQGRLLKERFWDQCTLFDVTFRPRGMSPEELEAGFHWLMGEVYRETEVARRRARFRECRRVARKEATLEG